MAALPGSEWSAEPPPASPRALGTVRHVFTHFALDLSVERRSEGPAGGWWQPLDRLAEAGLPSLYRRAAQLALADAPRAA